jgi:hypothetical protein
MLVGYILVLEYDQVEGVCKWYLCSGCVTRKLHAGRVVIDVLFIPYFQAHVLNVLTRIIFQTYNSFD